jgi:hypothetical protein
VAPTRRASISRPQVRPEDESGAGEVAGVTGQNPTAGRAVVGVGPTVSVWGAGDRVGQVTDTRCVSPVAATSGAAGIVARPGPKPTAEPLPRPQHGHVVVPRVGLQFSHQLPFETWLGIGRHLAAVSTSSAWCLGDWLVYGQELYPGRYQDALEWTGLDYQTLRNYAWVARRFGLSRRRDTLSFGHHAEVAALPEPEQEFWLRKAEQIGWSTSRLRREVRASLRERENGQTDNELASQGQISKTNRTTPAQRKDPHVIIRVHLTPGQAQLCERVAAKQGLAVDAWASRVLGHVAQDNSPWNTPTPNDPHGRMAPAIKGAQT